MPELPLVSPLDRVLFLRAHPYFRRLDAPLLAVLASHTVERHFRHGEVLIPEGEPNRFFYILGEGRVRTTETGRAFFDVSAPGGVGMLHTIARRSRETGAIALSDGLALEIEIESYLQIVEDHFPMVLLHANVTSRLAAEAERAIGLCPGCSERPRVAVSEVVESLDLVECLARVRRTELFARANLALLIELYRGHPERRLQAGEQLWQAGEPADSFGLVAEGVIELEDQTANGRGYCAPGDLIGLGDLFTEWPRVWGARAKTDALILCVERSRYIDVLEDHFDHALDLLAQLASRYLDLRARVSESGGSIQPEDGA